MKPGFDIETKNNFNYKKNKQRFKLYCSNCGKNDHMYKYCNESITSYGMILLSVSSDDEKLIPKLIRELESGEKKKIRSSGVQYTNVADIELFCKYKDNIKFLMIRRKHTLGFIEFMRGRYNVDNVDGIIFLFKQMIPEEIKKISECTFEELWNDLWSNNKNKNAYYTEYIQSKQKFDKLKNDKEMIGLDFYLENVTPSWTFAEWGFPKGRRNYQERDIECAKREFSEEAGFNESEYILLENIEPFVEILIGTNGISYKHVYYVALATTDKLVSIDPKNRSQYDEIGAINWFTFEEAINIIRPHHNERKELIGEMYMFLINTIVNISNK